MFFNKGKSSSVGQSLVRSPIVAPTAAQVAAATASRTDNQVQTAVNLGMQSGLAPTKFMNPGEMSQQAALRILMFSPDDFTVTWSSMGICFDTGLAREVNAIMTSANFAPMIPLQNSIQLAAFPTVQTLSAPIGQGGTIPLLKLEIGYSTSVAPAPINITINGYYANKQPFTAWMIGGLGWNIIASPKRFGTNVMYLAIPQMFGGSSRPAAALISNAVGNDPFNYNLTVTHNAGAIGQTATISTVTDRSDPMIVDLIRQCHILSMDAQLGEYVTEMRLQAAS